MKILDIMKMVFSGIVGFFSYLYGGFDMLLSVLLFCIVADYITGILAAIYLKNLNSEVGFRGIIKKVVILIVVALACEIGKATGANTIRDIVISFYIANEGLSILENAGKMDIPYLKQLKDILEQLKKE